MYIFKFSTLEKKEDVIIKGDFPSKYAQELWNKGIKFIIVSTYSNTIKIPRKVEYNDYGENHVDFDEYKI